MKILCLTAAVVVTLCANVQAQHLWWDLQGQKDATCLYGQITVLATHPAIYDRATKAWLHGTTITNPNGGKPSVATAVSRIAPPVSAEVTLHRPKQCRWCSHGRSL